MYHPRHVGLFRKWLMTPITANNKKGSNVSTKADTNKAKIGDPDMKCMKLIMDFAPPPTQQDRYFCPKQDNRQNIASVMSRHVSLYH